MVDELGVGSLGRARQQGQEERHLGYCYTPVGGLLGLRAWIVGAASPLVVWVLLALALDLYGGRPFEPGPYDAIVVAGAGVMPGGVPSDVLVARTYRAVELHRQGVAPRLALTGGIGDWGPAESVVAERLAVGWGVPPDAIVREERSTNTEENAAELFRTVGDLRVLVVTDRYHALRCERVFRRYFTRVEVTGAVSPPALRARGALREVGAIAWYTMRGRMQEGK